MTYEMIGPQAITAIIIMLTFGIFVPLAAAIIWTRIKKDRFTTVLLGAAGFAVFAIVLESIPKLLFFGKNAVGAFVMSHNWAYILIGALIAGVFEETARFFVFKVLIKKRRNKATAISYGIGHGGIEVMYLFVITATNYLIYAILINTGGFAEVVSLVSATDIDQAVQLNQLAVILAGLKPIDTLPGLVERISAMLFHVSCSIIVFRGVREKGKIWLYPVAIGLHTAFDCIAGLYQVQIITNGYLLEAIIFVVSVVVFVFAIMIYKKMPDEYASDEDDEAKKQLEDIKKLGV